MARDSGESDLPLFDPALVQLSRAYTGVEAIRLDEAIAAFKEYLKVFPTDSEVVNVLSSLQWLARCRPRADAPTGEDWFAWWRRVEKDAGRYRILDTRLYRCLRRGILRRILGGMLASGRKSLHGVHLGFLFLEIEQYGDAARELRLAAGENPESSSIYGPLAEAEYRLGQAEAAERSYGLALLYEPLRCGFTCFSHPGIAGVQKKLESTGMSAELARENLLVQCWLEAVLSLPPLPSALSLQNLIRRARDLEPIARQHGRLVLVEDARLFRWCLQISSSVRPDMSPSEEDLAWAEERMGERDSRAFGVYRERRRLEELQAEETELLPRSRNASVLAQVTP
ncbi:MAG: hypothetical protein HYU36_14225 [Planctomycetes bacterium]|nr:hypothetical protein [Planctomycetota bacterium]